MIDQNKICRKRRTEDKIEDKYSQRIAQLQRDKKSLLVRRVKLSGGN